MEIEGLNYFTKRNRQLFLIDCNNINEKQIYICMTVVVIKVLLLYMSAYVHINQLLANHD